MGRDPKLIVAEGDRFPASAARELARALSTAIEARGEASVAFSGGSTVGPVFDALVAMAEDPPSPQFAVDWAMVRVTQVDERVVPLDHPDRNAAVLIDRLVEALPVPPARVELLPVELVDASGGGGWLDESLRRLGEVAGTDLAGVDPNAMRVDVVQLGLGSDGHTASLVPGDSALGVDDRPVALTAPYQGQRRLTLTYPVLNAAGARVWWVRDAAEGQTKARAALALVEGDASTPAGRIERAQTVIVIDARAPTASTSVLRGCR